MANEARASGGFDSASRQDQQRSGDRTGTTYGALARRDLGDKPSDMADDVSNKAREAGYTLMDRASDVGHSVQEAGHNIAEKSKHTHQAICGFTKENPTAAVLMAFGLGALLARILPGR